MRLAISSRVISELLDRVEALKRRVGVQRPATGTAGAPERNAVPHTGKNPEGGTERAPRTVVIEEGAAERARERSWTREGTLLLPSGVLEVEPRFTCARREDAASRFIASAGVLTAAQTRRNADSATADLALRLGLPWDSQLEIGSTLLARGTLLNLSVGIGLTKDADDFSITLSLPIRFSGM
jgi:hypothetical protein